MDTNRGRVRLTSEGHEESFWDVGNILHLDLGGGYLGLQSKKKKKKSYIYNKHTLCTLCVLYLNTKIKGGRKGRTQVSVANCTGDGSLWSSVGLSFESNQETKMLFKEQHRARSH